jgi:hypothetical protein
MIWRLHLDQVDSHQKYLFGCVMHMIINNCGNHLLLRSLDNNFYQQASKIILIHLLIYQWGIQIHLA